MSWSQLRLAPRLHLRFQSLLLSPLNAANDAYSADFNTPLSVAAPGVLTNDVDPAGRSLTAFLQSGASSGSVTFNTDGSFTYTPSNGFSGSDSFTYRAYNGVVYSNTATVTITITVGPTVATVSPSSGPRTGRTQVIISGSGFSGTPSVTFGGTPALSVTDVTPTSLKAVTPISNARATPRLVDVVVNVGGQSATLVNGFTYVKEPIVTDVTPSVGEPGTLVQIGGTDFPMNPKVFFGEYQSTQVTWISATLVEAVAPNGIGTVEVKVQGSNQIPDASKRAFRDTTNMFTFILSGSE